MSGTTVEAGIESGCTSFENCVADGVEGMEKDMSFEERKGINGL